MVTLLAFVFVLGVLVFVHEAGHFLVAKYFGIKVNVFSLGFPPKLIGRKWGDTEYRIGMLPIGGYVRMAGDNPMESTGDPDEFMSRPKWQRLAVYFAGPAMNFILTIGLLTALFMIGVERPAGLEDTPVVRYVSADSPAGRAGVAAGDRILAINGRDVTTWREAIEIFLVSARETLPVSVQRGDAPVLVEIEVEARGEEDYGFTGLFPAVQPSVAAVRDDFPAQRAGVKPGDIIASVDDKPIISRDELIEEIMKREGASLRLGLIRNEANLSIELTPKKEDDRWLIGIEFPSPVVIQRASGLGNAVGLATNESIRFTRMMFVILGRMVSGRGSVKQISGPIGIARISGETARRGSKDLFYLMAILSLNLGVLNLLPIPLLDGGHMAIISLEGLAGRDFSLAVKERILQFGFVMLLLLMVTVIYLDLSKIDAIGRFLPF